MVNRIHLRRAIRNAVTARDGSVGHMDTYLVGNVEAACTESLMWVLVNVYECKHDSTNHTVLHCLQVVGT